MSKLTIFNIIFLLALVFAFFRLGTYSKALRSLEKLETKKEKKIKKLEKMPVSEEVKSEILREIIRLSNTYSHSESQNIRDYLDWVFSLPWGQETEDNLDIENAQKVLDQDHYGLEKIKDIILDFIAVRRLKKDGKTPILCFVGPPGTGKTSLGQSIAKCLGRKFIRMALGGLRDGDEIRGCRRSYVNAMPGRFIQAIRKAETCNPVILLDEIDKVTNSNNTSRGNVAAALLEVLDPEQNKKFHDNYLGIPFDLSKVIFIATANDLNAISGPLADRMEVVPLSGYTLEEKLNIAKNHLVKKAVQDTGLQDYNITINDTVIRSLVTSYTREAGVRELDRLVRKLCAKEARELAKEKDIVAFTKHNLETYLGPKKFLPNEALKKDKIGVTNGLCCTLSGGQIVQVEAVIFPGKGDVKLTGQLGDIAKESAEAALSYVKTQAKEFGINAKLFKENDLHINFPGANPKDGDSAGITMLTSIVSAFTKKPVSAKYAMTGAINLAGDVMPIGGVKEKLLAAKSHNIPYIILPEKNKNDFIGLEKIAKGIEVIWSNKANEVIKRVLGL